MSAATDDSQRRLVARVEQALLRCVDWSHAGRHRKVLAEVERLLPLTKNDPQLETQLLMWKAQALISMGCADRALRAASRCWELDATPHSCHVMATTLHAVGEQDQAEQLLQMGIGIFPNAVHLPLQLAMMLADQGRVPEAIDTIEGIPPETEIPDDLRVFLLGLRANLLATMGKWGEADAVLRRGLDDHPGSTLLQETHETISRAWRRNRSERDLVASWEATIEELADVEVEVDDAIVRAGSVTELPAIRVLAARRLWRAFVMAATVRPQAPNAWGAALLVAIAELDGERPSAAAMARAVGAQPATVRSVLRRLRAFLAHLEPSFAQRSFAARANPRLDEPAASKLPDQPDNLIAFPDVSGSFDP